MNIPVTEKLYYEDVRRTAFNAAVLSCLPAAGNGALGVVLDRTAFFPEAGGQKADRGDLNGVPVLDVHILDGVVTHLVDASHRDRFPVGASVNGRVDWEQRFDFMQQHTGEHILSGLASRLYGYRNVGFHLGYGEVTLDFNGPLSPEALRDLERAANEAVFADLPVLISYPDKKTLQSLSYRSKLELETDVRIVEIPGYDVCACCAPHVDRTGQIGLIKIADAQSHRGGIRLNILCGRRALADYAAKQEAVTDISVRLSAKQEAVPEAVARLKAESEGRKERINALQALLLEAHIKALVPGGAGHALLFEEQLDAAAMRNAVNRLVLSFSGYCCVFSGDGRQGYRFAAGSAALDCLALADALRERFRAKSGGSAPMIQGTVAAARADIEQFFLQCQGPIASPAEGAAK